MGNEQVIREGDVQVMSAGSGIMHSENNASQEDKVKFLQIWVVPSERGGKPGYAQTKIEQNLCRVCADQTSPLLIPRHQNTANAPNPEAPRLFGIERPTVFRKRRTPQYPSNNAIPAKTEGTSPA